MEEKFSFKKGYRGRAIFRIANVIFLIILMLVTIIPILKIVCDSLDGSGAYGMAFIPKKFTFAGYLKIFTANEMYHPFWVSFYTTVIGTFVGLTLCTLGAYVLIQEDMPGNKILVWMIFLTMIFDAGIVPTYLLIKKIHLMNTVWAVVLTLAINVYNMILMRSFFEGIPKSLMEAAEIDGCTPMQIFLKIVLPLSKPALASIGLFYAVTYWNEFYHFVIYVTDKDKLNFQVKLRSLVLDSNDLQNANSDGSTGLGNTIKNAAVIVSMIPPMIIYPFCQKYFVSGVTLGAVKE